MDLISTLSPIMPCTTVSKCLEIINLFFFYKEHLVPFLEWAAEEPRKLSLLYQKFYGIAINSMQTMKPWERMSSHKDGLSMMIYEDINMVSAFIFFLQEYQEYSSKMIELSLWVLIEVLLIR